MTSSLYDIALHAIDGTPVTLNSFKGKVLLIVNVASKCGFTPQYKGLQTLFDARQADGLVILGFPSNDFKGQEPGTNAEISSFCSTEYGVTFPLFAKIAVAEPSHPLYAALTACLPKATGGDAMRARLEGFGVKAAPEPAVLWNFEKFVVDGNGEVVARFSPDVGPDDARLTAAIDAALAAAPVA